MKKLKDTVQIKVGLHFAFEKVSLSFLILQLCSFNGCFKEMSNIYVNSFYQEKLMFSKIRFFKLKKLLSLPVSSELQLTQVSFF